VLKSARIAGLRAHKGETVGKAVWPAIIAVEEHEALVNLFKARRASSKTSGAYKRTYLLTGLLFCQRCGARLVARRRDDRTASYQCIKEVLTDGCGGVRVVGPKVDDLVIEAVIVALDTPMLANMLAAKPASPEMAGLPAAIVADEARLAELATIYADGDISRSEWMTARERVNERLELNRNKLADSQQGQLPRLDNLRDRWESLDLAQRRSVIGALIERIEIAPAMKRGPHFEPDRVTIKWRF
jgi:hypothetical protein